MSMRFAVALAVCVCGLSASSVLAQETWKTVVLSSNPQVIIDVPDSAGDVLDGATGEDLMFLALDEQTGGSLVCTVLRSSYGPKFDRQATSEGLGKAPQRLCPQVGPTMSEYTVDEAESFGQDDLHAVACTASYLDSTKDLPAEIKSTLLILAPDAGYSLGCLASHEDIEAASDA